MNCTNCGTPLRDGDLFCTNCGANVNETPAVPSDIGTTPEPPVKKSKKKKVLIITAIATVFAIVAGILSWAFIFSKQTVYALVSERHYNADGVFHEYYEYEYDKNGNLLKEESDRGYENEEIWDEENGVYKYIIHDLEPDGTNLTVTEYEYDENGYPVSKRRNQTGQNSIRTKYEYEFDGKLVTEIEETTIIDAGRVDNEKRRVRYYLEYNDEDLLVEVKVKNSSGSKTDYLELEYDVDGNLLSILTHGVESQKLEYEYRDGKMTEVGRYMSYNQEDWNELFLIEYEYDDDGRLTEAGEFEYDYDKKGNLISVESDAVEYEYQYDGRKITEATCTAYGYEGTESAEMEYDKSGNLIKSTAKDGSYIVYEYQKLRLSKKDATRFRAHQPKRSLSGSFATENWSYAVFLDSLPVFFKYLVEIPIDPAYGTGPMFRGKS